MRIHIVNPSDISFGTAVITPRWLYVLAAATPAHYGTPVVVDETADIEKAAHDIVMGASTDNNIICTDEKETVAVASITDQLRGMHAHGFLTGRGADVESRAFQITRSAPPAG